jgi:Na+/melibiose symporter-like transporter
VDVARESDFRRLWAAQSVSTVGSQVSAIALPLAAILTLGAGAWEVGVLRAAGNAPVLVLGVFVGVWVDRAQGAPGRRRLMIATDLGRAALLSAIPLAALAGGLRIELLYAVALLVGVLSLFFDVASFSFLPTVVARERLVEGNSRLWLSSSTASVVGPAAAGWLVEALTAPTAVWVDALSFGGSALLLSSIRAVEAPPRPAAERRIRDEIAEGIALLWRDRTLRAITGAATVGAMGSSMHATILVLYATQTLGLEPSLLGAVVAVGSAGAIGAAALVDRVSRRLGPGPAVMWGQLVVTIGTALLPLAVWAPGAAVPLVVLGQALFSAAITVVAVNQVSLRQAVTPNHLLGRVNASRRVLVFGIQPIGALLAGALGESIGLPATLGVAAGVELLAFVVALASPLREIKETPPAVGTS